MSEEDIDLRELIKAIKAGDKEKAESIAITLFKNPPNPNKYVAKVKSDPNPELLLQIIAGGIVIIFAILAFLDFWFSHRSKKKEEIQYV
ncbi:MAG: hypothetical protein H3Z53_05650 [archaeon]|nr:hypothetical protein [archaeon]MCP8313841.1 hypothetical protein [archaeon]